MTTKKQQQLEQRIAVAAACEAFKKELKEHYDIARDYDNAVKKQEEKMKCITNEILEFFENHLNADMLLVDKVKKRKELKTTNQYQRLLEKLSEEEKQLKLFKDFQGVLWRNFEIYIQKNFMKTFSLFLKQFNGKKYGTKTAGKIRKEFLELTDLSVYITNDYTQKIDFVPCGGFASAPFNYNSFVFYLNDYNTVISEENTIHVKENYFYQTTDSEIIPFEQIRKTIEKWSAEKEQLEKEKAELEKRIKEYNSKTFGTFKIK